MTDTQALFTYRLRQAAETLRDAEKMLHRMFNARQECDYKELVESSAEEAAESIKMANEFVRTIKSFIDEQSEL